MGRDVSGEAHREPEEINESCAAARPHGGERACIRFAAMDMVANFAGGVEASALCTSTTPRLRAPCFRAVGTIMGRLHTTDRPRRRARAGRSRRRRATSLRALAASSKDCPAAVAS